MKRYIVERTDKAEISPEEQSEKAESCRENLWNEIVNGCFEPSQPLGIISGLKETFIKRYIVERTNEAEIRPEEQSEKAESCRENFWTEIQLKEP